MFRSLRAASLKDVLQECLSEIDELPDETILLITNHLKLYWDIPGRK